MQILFTLECIVSDRHCELVAAIPSVLSFELPGSPPFTSNQACVTLRVGVGDASDGTSASSQPKF